MSENEKGFNEEKICELLFKYKSEKIEMFKFIVKKLKNFKKRKDMMRLRGFNDFNYISLLRDFKDETAHSQIIAEFLNPRGTHYQGNIFLKNFLEIVKINFLAKDTEKNTENIEVYTEHFVNVDNQRGRIDIFIKSEKNVIIIENKIWARDREAQIDKYVKGILEKNCDVKIFVLYLTIEGRQPPEYSFKNNLGKENVEVKVISYEDILKWMEKNLKDMENLSSLRESIKQYIKSVKNILGKESDIMNLKEYLLKKENREILINLIEHEEEFFKYVEEKDNECKKIAEEEGLREILSAIKYECRKKLAEKIKEAVEKEFENKKDYKVIDDGFCNGRRFGALRIACKNWKKNKDGGWDEGNYDYFKYTLQFDRKNFKDFIYGIAKTIETKPYEGKNIPEDLKEILRIDSTFRHQVWWLLYKSIDVFSNYKEILFLSNSDLDEFVRKKFLEPLNKLIKSTKGKLDNFFEKYNKKNI